MATNLQFEWSSQFGKVAPGCELRIGQRRNAARRRSPLRVAQCISLAGPRRTAHFIDLVVDYGEAKIERDGRFKYVDCLPDLYSISTRQVLPSLYLI